MHKPPTCQNQRPAVFAMNDALISVQKVAYGPHVHSDFSIWILDQKNMKTRFAGFIGVRHEFFKSDVRDVTSAS